MPRRLRYLTIILLVLTTGAAVGQSTVIARQLRAWKLLPQPERFSELYFSDQRHLPANFVANQLQDVGFTVRNLESRPTDYHYQVVAQTANNGAVKTLASGQFKLDHQQSLATHRPVKVPALGPRLKLQVELQYQAIAWGQDALSTQKQTIHYWVTATDKLAQQPTEGSND